MIVYRDRRERIDGPGQVHNIASQVRRLREGTSVEHADAVGLLIDLGEFETAVETETGEVLRIEDHRQAPKTSLVADTRSSTGFIAARRRRA